MHLLYWNQQGKAHAERQWEGACAQKCVWKICIACAAHMQLMFACATCRVAAVGVKSQDSSGEIWFVWFTYLLSCRLSSCSRTLAKDVSQCEHPSAVHLQWSAGMPCYMGAGLYVDLQTELWCCLHLRPRSTDMPVLAFWWSGLCSPIWPPYMPLSSWNTNREYSSIGAAKRRRERNGKEISLQRDGVNVSRAWREGLVHVEAGTMQGLEDSIGKSWDKPVYPCLQLVRWGLLSQMFIFWKGGSVCLC